MGYLFAALIVAAFLLWEMREVLFILIAFYVVAGIALAFLPKGNKL